MTDLHTPLPHHPWSWRRGAWPAYVEVLKHTDWPILCGPWHGEIGFEVLYWIPFLEHLKQQGIKPERLIPISRGGASAWYGTPTGLELFAMRSPQQLRIENRLAHGKTGLLKQVSVSKWDQAVIRDAAETLNLTRYHVLHPSWMYHGLAPYWTGRMGPHWLIQRASYPALSVPSVPQDLALPELFVAAKFYSRETWSAMDKQVKQATGAVLLKLAEQSPVVVIESETFADEHADFGIPSHPNLLRLRDLTTLRPETNLAVQSAVIAKAQGFVGTYGGMAQLALRMGKSSVSFYAHWGGTAVTHLMLSELLALQNKMLFHTVELNKIPLLLSVLPPAAIRVPGKQLDTSSKNELLTQV